MPTPRLAHLQQPVVVLSTLVAACAALFAHVLFLTHAGALWRDEVNTVAFAEMPSLGTIAAMLRYDSVPLASTLLVHAAARLGLGSDASLRALGFVLGCATLVALWWSARRNRVALPVCTILLFAFNLWVIRGGDAVRPAGLGMLTIVLTFSALAAALQEPRPWRIAAAAACAVLAVQSIYSNVPLVAGICLAGVAVGAVSRSRQRIALSVGIGAIAALSLLPYVPAIQAAREWGVLVQSRPDLKQLWSALGSTDAWDAWAWALLAIVGLAVAGVRPTANLRTVALGDVGRERSLYAAGALVLGGLGFLLLIESSRLSTQPWYYLPLMALGAASLDVLLGALTRRPAAGIAVAVVLIVATVAHLAVLAPMLRLRQTNVDLIAAQLAASAARRDLIIVSPWFHGVTFHRYYTGAAPWLTIPPLEDTSIHRYDLLKRQMQDPAAMDRVLQDSTLTLQAGARVWIVGVLTPLPDGTTAQPPPRAPAPGLGWNGDAYFDRWSQLVYALARDHVATVERVAVPVPDPVSRYEDVPLFVMQGWR